MKTCNNSQDDKIRPQSSSSASATQRKLSKKDKAKPSRAAEAHKYKELMKTIPDVRQEKIQAIKKQIESGTYDVPAEQVAKSIIESAKNKPR